MLNGASVNGKHVFRGEWLYLNALSTDGCKFKLTFKFKDTQVQPSAQVTSFQESNDTIRIDSETYDFTKFSLGEGCAKEKLRRLEAIKEAVVSDTRQQRVCKQVVSKIKRKRSAPRILPHQTSMFTWHPHATMDP